MQSPSHRLSSIDALRGLAVVLMFMHHFPLFLMEGYSSSETYAAMFGLSRFAAPLFLFIVGFSMTLSAAKRIDQSGVSEALRHFLRRGLILIAAGFLLQALIYRPLSNFNILHTIGLSIILSSPLAVNPLPKRCVTAILAYAALSMALPASPLFNEMQGFFGFPIFPWASYVLFGIAAGYYAKDEKRMPRLLEAGALLFMASSFILTYSGERFDFDSYATASFITMSMSLIFYLTALLFWVYEVYKINPLPLKPFVVYGRHAFFLYFIHHIFIATIPKMLGLENTFSLTASLGALIIFLALSFLLFSSNAYSIIQRKKWM